MGVIYGYSRSNRLYNGVTIQNKILTEYAKRVNHSLLLYTDSNSGQVIGYNLQRLITDIPPKSTLITTSENRLTRNRYYMELIMKELNNKDIQLIIIGKNVIDIKDVRW